MKRYNVLIIGAGIAGTGLAYNLRKKGYKGKILIIDKKRPNEKRDSYRNTFSEVINEYGIPFEKKFKGLKIGIYDKELFNLNIDFYLVNYKNVCNYLLKKSNVDFKKETAKELKNDVLITNKGEYIADYIIDCSGISFFIKKELNMQLPFRYWIGHVKKIKKENCQFKENYFNYQFSDIGYFEDIYLIKRSVVQGDWTYVNEINFNLLKRHNKRLYDKFLFDGIIEEEYFAAIPCTPVFPLVYNNIAFLGDSFGNATTSAAEGIRPILDSSKILADSIIKNDLKEYEKRWIKKYFKIYFKHLITRIDGYDETTISKIFRYPKYSEFLEEMKDYKEIILKRLRNEEYEMPKELIKKFPIYSLLIRQFLFWSYLKIKYGLM